MPRGPCSTAPAKKERGERRKSYRAAANYQSCRALLPRHRSVPAAEPELKGCCELPAEPSALTLAQSSPAPHQTRSLSLAGQTRGGRKRSPFIPASRSHLASARGERRQRLHLAGEREQLLGPASTAACAPRATAKCGAVGTSVRQQQGTPCALHKLFAALFAPRSSGQH